MAMQTKTSKGFQQVSVLTATPLTVVTGANDAVISVEGAAVRYRDDGVAPTTTTGVLLYPGGTLEIFDVTLLNSIQFISQDGATTATLNVSYYQIQ